MFGGKVFKILNLPMTRMNYRLLHQKVGADGVVEALKWSYRYGTHNVPLVGLTIGKLIDLAAENHPDDEAFIDVTANKRLTFAELRKEADKFAAGLLELGLRRGDRIGVWGPNSLEWIIAQYGTARAGIIQVNVNPAYQTDELEYCLKKVGCKAVLSAVNFKGTDYYKMLEELSPELSTSLPGALQSKRIPSLKSVIMMSEKKCPGTMSFNELMKCAGNDKFKQVLEMQDHLQFDDPINIQYTSGTTGSPKAATLSHHNVVNNSYFVGLRNEYHKHHSRICMPVPLYHCFGMVLGSLCALTHGSAVILPSPGFDAEACLQAIQWEKCTSFYGTPTMFIDILNHPNFDQYDKGTLHTGIMAGAPCPIEVAKKVATKMNMPDFMIAYGQTETSPVTFMTKMTDPIEHRTESIGHIMPYVEAKIVDDENRVLPIGSKGELCTRGTTSMLYYWGDQKKTNETFRGGWLHSGDLAVLSPEGRCYIVGRKKDVIIRGGENIYPTEIEQFLFEHDGIEDVQVIGIPDKRMGEEVCACIRVKSKQTVTAQQIKDFCKGKISHYKIPKYVVVVKEFPMTVTGKIQKYRLVDQMVNELNLKGQI
ncbi:medium-chain acyl-CoA ligase ACSF2, mitochondrial-like isoform X2 [Tubulanus polymorphus]|uniref:medium-chain acyl-CoA ligase ACSF2, mitochondrial-like isoform X2 n=1 Tax=Tubulanus polymorphus TaxID=672921 RepID=UPI003DA56E4C